METNTKIVAGAFVAYLLLQFSRPNGTTPTNPDMEETFFFPPVDNSQIRSDSWGGGHFGDSRDGGKRRHNGLDLIVQKGQAVYCPIDCYVTRNTTVYPSDPDWKGIVLRGINEYEGIEVKIFYMESVVMKNDFIPKGQLIGFAQAISERYSPEMIDHIHLEIRDNKQLVDPMDYLFPTA